MTEEDQQQQQQQQPCSESMKSSWEARKKEKGDKDKERSYCGQWKKITIGKEKREREERCWEEKRRGAEMGRCADCQCSSPQSRRGHNNPKQTQDL